MFFYYSLQLTFTTADICNLELIRLCQHCSPCIPVLLFPRMHHKYSNVHSYCVYVAESYSVLASILLRGCSGGHTLRVRTSWCFIFTVKIV